MPYDNPDPNDPTMLVGVELPATLESVREMAYTFAQELTLCGHPKHRIEKIFRTPFYAGPHRAYALLGPDETQQIVDDVFNAFGTRFVVRDSEPSADPLPPPSGEELVAHPRKRAGREE